MIIGGDKSAVIENIRKNVKEGELNKKAELDDPKISDEEIDRVIGDFEKYQNKKVWYFLKSRPAFAMVNAVWAMHKNVTEFDGLEKLDELKGGAIVTSNHFNPIDSIFARAVLKKKFHKTPYIVVQDTNFAMTGLLGYLFNNLKMIPILKRPNYIIKKFTPRVKELVGAGEFVQIYPEEEMWFNYKKPRPCKRGAYQFAAENNKPIISCFVEIQDLEEMDNDEFSQVKYIIHVLKPIYPDSSLSIRENSIKMAEIDYNQKKEAYEKYYGKALTYDFSYDDIAGYKCKTLKK